eukprot:1295831-Pyramimonas_sp.AAC.1
MVVAVQYDETGKLKPPKGPPGGPVGGGDPDGDGGRGPRGHHDPTMQTFNASQMGANWRSWGNNEELNLLDTPSAQTL